MRRVHVFIHGMVHGVFFRANIQRKAIELDVTGYAKNTDDGDVECIFEGEEEDIDEMLEFCREGPRNAQVEDVDIEDENYTGEFDNFEIRY
ncbi:MAG: acylphosphatase [Candidatus Aenigmatarchaeota archaeon]